MPTYSYKVRDGEGKIIEGQIDASDGKILRKTLGEKNYFIIEYQEKKSKLSYFSPDVFLNLKKISFKEISVFSWELYTMLNAGLPLEFLD